MRSGLHRHPVCDGLLSSPWYFRPAVALSPSILVLLLGEGMSVLKREPPLLHREGPLNDPELLLTPPLPILSIDKIFSLPGHAPTGHSSSSSAEPTTRGRWSFIDCFLRLSEQFMVVGLLQRLSEKLPRVVHRLSEMMKPQVVFVLGGPGAGKGTQCERIVKNYSYTHLSAGDLLREERSRTGSEFGQLIDTYIKEGKIAMEETMKSDEKKFRFLIDGFPRNQDNLQGWNNVMDGKADVKFVLFFDCSSEVCIDRCLERGKSSGRTDDNRESLEKRIQTYLQSTRPIIEQYEQQGKVHKIDASRSVDEVFADVKNILENQG
ncbi:hypothetical protein DNTS_002596 [Danionella cerebrum]|uniref:UMP-CMP kinase n=1 Tax=Danionella cerebrum TaxID=2873325 RepID=A0A553R5U4_9TELE|nr:hypothetical protein DNTS_002596 [Danionella translucida]